MAIIRTGQELRLDLMNMEITRKALIDEFLFERDIFMLTAGAGLGKSIISTQLAISLSFGTPLFGVLKIPSPKRVYVIQTEGDYEESIERMRLMETNGGIIIEDGNICWHEEKEIDLMDELSTELLLEKIRKTNFKPDVIIIDPIYKLCSSDMSTGKAAIKIVKFSDMLYTEFKCTNVLINHSTKSDFIIIDGKKQMKEDAYYGHSFIKNHVRTAYYVSETDDGRMLKRTKGRGSDTLFKMKLVYEPDSMTLKMDGGSGSASERVRLFCSTIKRQNRTTCFREVSESCEISDQHLRRLKKIDEISDIFSFISEKGKADKWIPI